MKQNTTKKRMMVGVLTALSFNAATAQTAADDVFYETMGAPTAVIPIGSNTFSNSGSGVLYSGSAEVTFTNTSAGDYDRASADGNVYFNDAGDSLVMDNIDISGVTEPMRLYFGLRKTIQAAGQTDFVVKVIVDGVQTATFSPSLASGINYQWILGPTVANGSVLKLVFERSASSPVLRLDDVLVSKNTTPVSIALNSFTGRLVGDKHHLDWKATVEDNCKGFNVLQSTDGKAFNAVGFVDVNSNSSNDEQMIGYTFDKSATAERVFYKIRQINLDGAASESNVIVLNGTLQKVNSIYPNPAQNTIKIDGLAGTETIRVYNALGNLVKTVNASSTSIDVAELAAGIYNIQIVDANKVANHKLVIAK